MEKFMLQKFGLVLLVRVGIPILRESGRLTLRGKLGARLFYGFVCVAPLRLRGKKTTLNVCWEVPVRSQRLASGSKEETLVAKEHHQVHHHHQLRYFY